MREIKFRGYWKTKSYNLEGLEYQTLTDSKVTYIDGTSENRMVGHDTIQELYRYDDLTDKLQLMQFTGFKDCNGIEIFEGDIIGDWTDTYEGLVQSRCQVFWCDKTGSWMMDQSLKQDKSDGVILWLELHDFEYEVLGNIYENKNHK